MKALKNPEYLRISSELAETVKQDQESILKQAQEIILEDITGTIKTLLALRADPDPSISLKACKEHLMLAGMYTQKVEHSGNLESIQVYLPAVDGGERR